MVSLVRYSQNPILTPRPKIKWESWATFNPGAVRDEHAIHILYRAVDGNGVSSLGYAKSLDGGSVYDRMAHPVLQPDSDWEKFGCEDPRITWFEGHYWVFYTAFSQRGPRIALASTLDFRKFKKYGVVGPDRKDKDCALFPERIDGKIVILHRIEPNVQIAYFDDLETLKRPGQYWTEYMKDLDRHVVMYREFPWESKKIGIGAPPIKTKEGWLVLYHGVDGNHVYRAGVALLDLEDPTRVIGRTRDPILEPQEEFERHGNVPNVVFPAGSVVVRGNLRVYYGAADKVTCVAEAPLKEIIESLTQG